MRDDRPDTDRKSSSRAGAPSQLIKQLTQLDDEIFGSLLFHWTTGQTTFNVRKRREGGE